MAAVALLAALPLGAANKQKIFPVTSDIPEALAVLYLSQGRALPSTTAPYSRAELEMMLDRIDAGSLDEAGRAAYAYITRQLDADPPMWQAPYVGISLRPSANFEGYVHANDAFRGKDDFVYGYMDQQPFANLGFEVWPGDRFYAVTDLTIQNTKWMEHEFGKYFVGNNLWGLWPSDFRDWDQGTPFRAFAAFGGDYWSFQIGRDRLNWGTGVTGNLTMGDNLQYHNLVRFTSFSPMFKYTFVTSFFPHPSSYVGDDDRGDDSTITKKYGKDWAVYGEDQDKVLDGINLFMAHRLEWNMFHDRFGVVLTEAIMYQSMENTLDLRVFNPVGIYHDYYIRANANSLLSFELNYTPKKGVNIYGQLAVDQFAVPGEESQASSNKAAEPNALGFLVGARDVWQVGDEPVWAWVNLEAAYTMPYLYLRFATDHGYQGEYNPVNDYSKDSYDHYGLNYVGAIRQYHNSEEIRYESSWLGYRFGPDAIVVDLRGGVKRYGLFSLEGNIFFMAHGTHDLYTVWSQIGGKSGVPAHLHTPTSKHHTYNYNYRDGKVPKNEKNAVEYTAVAGVHGSYVVSDHWKIWGQVDYVFAGNKDNRKGKHEHDVQVVAGAGWTF